MERRRTIRLLADGGLVSIGRRTGDLPAAGWPLRDISEGGVRFAVPQDLPGLPRPGEHVVVTVEIGASAGRGAPPGSGPAPGKGRAGGGHQLSAIVRRVRKVGRGESEVSLEFTGLSPADRERMRGTVLDLAVEKLEKDVGAPARAPSEADEKPGGGRLGDLLVARSALSRDEVERFVSEDLEDGRPLGRQLVAGGLVDEKDVARALAEQSGLEHVDLDVEGVDLLKVRRLGLEYLTRHLFVPLGTDAARVRLAAAAPLSKDTTDTVEKLWNRRATVAIASERQIVSAIQKAFHVARNRRGSVRFPAGLSVRFRLYDEDWRPLHEGVLVGLTKNLSEGGLLFVGPKPAGVNLAGDRIHVGVHLFLPNQDEPVRAPCEMVRATPVSEDDGDVSLFLYAAKVLGLSGEDRKRLNLFRVGEYVRRTARDGRAPLRGT